MARVKFGRALFIRPVGQFAGSRARRKVARRDRVTPPVALASARRAERPGALISTTAPTTSSRKCAVCATSARGSPAQSGCPPPTTSSSSCSSPQIGGCGSYWMPRRTSRARSTPASRSTRCRDMSMPAETPALVSTSPSSTKQAPTSVSMLVDLGEQVQRCPVRRRRPAGQQTCGGVHEAAGAHGSHERDGRALLAYPVEVFGVAQEPTVAESTGVDQDVVGRASSREWWRR
jgi:hypothetical protein